MWKHLRLPRSRLTRYLLAITYLFVVITIAQSIHRPMWFDEAWRPDFIDRNLQIPLAARQSYAPISLGMYLITKLAVVVADNNFTQRITTYLALLALPAITYWFCKVYVNVRTAQVMIPVSVLVGYVVEFSAQDKPYVADIVCTLLLLIAYQAYETNRLRLRYFILTSLVMLSISFAAFFTLTCIGILYLWRCYRQANRAVWTSFALWVGTVGLPGLIYLQFFIRPQLTSTLYTYWRSLYPSGNVFSMLHITVGNFMTMFDVYIGKTEVNPGLEPHALLWTDPELFYKHPILGISIVFSVVYLIAFIYGCVLLYRSRKRRILAVVSILLIIEWLAALARQWAFGNARTNLFSTFLLTIILVYGIIEGLKHLLKYRNLMLTAVLAALIVLILPYRSTYALLKGQNTFGGETFGGTMDGYASGVEGAALEVAAHSKRSDVLLVSGYIGPFGYDYYYRLSDYTKKYRSTETKQVYYGMTNDQSLPALYFNAQQQPAVVWAADIASVASFKVKTIQAAGYHITATYRYRDVVVYKLASTSPIKN